MSGIEQLFTVGNEDYMTINQKHSSAETFIKMSKGLTKVVDESLLFTVFWWDVQKLHSTTPCQFKQCKERK